jgi:hypothetical protein
MSTAWVNHFIFTFAQNSDALQSDQACPEMKIRVPAGTTAGLQTSFSIHTSAWRGLRPEIYKANSMGISQSPADGESGWDPDIFNAHRLQRRSAASARAISNPTLFSMKCSLRTATSQSNSRVERAHSSFCRGKKDSPFGTPSKWAVRRSSSGPMAGSGSRICGVRRERTGA